jgi:hypothetical protein
VNIYSSLITQQNSKKKPRRITFTLQIFYSNTLNFEESASLIASQSVSIGDYLNIKLYLSKSPQFLRIDPGFFYSVHQNLKVDIIQMDAEKEGLIICCNPESSTFTINSLNQVNTDDGILFICGHDSYYILKNPFLYSDICINFQSKLLLGISET